MFTSLLSDVFPGAQTTVENVPLTFSTSSNNALEASSVSNAVGLAVSSGTLTLSTTSGLSFINGTANGQGTIEFTGGSGSMNAALSGLVFTPASNFTGSDPLTFITGVQVLGIPTVFTTNTVPMTVTPAPPTVAKLAAASPGTVTGTSTALSVLGADDAGEANLTYTWTSLGTPPAAVTFSANGTNAAKNITATFSKPGSYQFQVTITDPAALSITSQTSATVVQTLNTITVSPGTASLNENQTQQFSALGYDQFGSLMSIQPTFLWSNTAGVGAISATGLYTAPYGTGSATIAAASGAVSGAAAITVTNAAPTVATISSANPLTVAGTTSALSVLGADDGGESNLTYSWSVLNKPAGAPVPTFSLNSSNTAKNTTVTFGQSGTYLLQATIIDAGGLSITSSVSVTVNQTLTTIAVSPANDSLAAGATKQFSAVALDQFGQNMLAQPTFNWSATGGGTINSTGFYTAPGAPTNATVYAASGSVQGSAGVTIVSNGTAVASPSVVIATTTNLSVLGGATVGVTYAWTVLTAPVGSATPTFSVNNSSAAQTTTATFFQSGSYTFQVAINNGSITTQDVSVTVQQTLSSVVVTPPAANLNENGHQQFSAVANDQFGIAMASVPTFNWAVVTGGGAIDGSGLFTAAGSLGAGSATISASVGSIAGTASINVTNAAPTVATPAAPAQSTVTGLSTLLSVLGADDGGESNLTYTWTVTGTPPAGVNFSINSSNSSKSTTAEFSKAGQYDFLVTITDAEGLSTTSATTVVVDQTLAGLTMTPSSPTMFQNAQQQFSASAFDQFGNSMTTPSLTWTISAGGGSISSTGLYTSPVGVGIANVVVSSGAVHHSAIITIANQAPTVQVAAAASATVVAGSTTDLSVLGADDGGESDLRYLWSTTGTAPATVQFSKNNTNAAKNVTATFSAVGTYDFLVTITDAQGASITSSVSVTVTPVMSEITVAPASASVHRGGTEQFTATARDQFGAALTSQPTVSWSMVGSAGSIDASGLYTAPNAGNGTITIVATTGGLSGTATVSLIDELSATVPATQTTLVNAPLLFANGNAISITDADTISSNVNILLSLMAADGVIKLSGENGLTFVQGTGKGDASMTFSGSLNNVNAALTGMAFIPDAGFTGAAGLTVTIDEVGSLASPSQSVAVNVNQPAINQSTSSVAGVSSTSTGGTFSTSTGGTLAGILDGNTTLTVQPASPAQSELNTGQSDDSVAVLAIPAADTSPPVVVAQAPAAPVAPLAPPPPAPAPAPPPVSTPTAPVVVPVVVALPNFAASVANPAPTKVTVSTDIRVETIPENVFPFLAKQSPMWKGLDQAKQDMVEETKLKVEAGSATVASLGASAAYLVWMLRGGSLLSSFLSIFPAWKSMDPLPVLDSFESERKRNKRRTAAEMESLESLVNKSNDAHKDLQ